MHTPPAFLLPALLPPALPRAARPLSPTRVHCTLAPTSRSLAPRADFPILHRAVNDHPLVYLDSAATSQKPQAVLDALRDYYESYNSNVHRGDHFLATAATDAVERTRALAAAFIAAPHTEELIFTRNATESINLVARAWGSTHLAKGDRILLSVMEHHANLVPWQMVAAETGAVIVPIPLSDAQDYNLDALRAELAKGRVKLVACSHVSNVLGCFNPVAEIANLAHEAGAIVLVDACQSVPNMPVDVQALGCDFLVASSHKMCGPTGVGFLWGRRALLEDMPPYMGGGEMIAEVYVERSTYGKIPHKYEAGTKAIGEIVALGAAIEYLNALGMEKVHQYEQELGEYLYKKLTAFREIHVYGPPPPRAGLCAFNIDGVHGTDLATMLDLEGVAVRSGHHCAQPLHRELGVTGSARASMYVYNTMEEIDQFMVALKETVELLGGTLTKK